MPGICFQIQQDREKWRSWYGTNLDNRRTWVMGTWVILSTFTYTWKFPQWQISCSNKGASSYLSTLIYFKLNPRRKKEHWPWAPKSGPECTEGPAVHAWRSLATSVFALLTWNHSNTKDTFWSLEDKWKTKSLILPNVPSSKNVMLLDISIVAYWSSM